MLNNMLKYFIETKMSVVPYFLTTAINKKTLF